MMMIEEQKDSRFLEDEEDDEYVPQSPLMGSYQTLPSDAGKESAEIDK